MKVVHTIQEMQKITSKLVENGESIGFVPTMGFLHDGHLELMRRAKAENSILISSIFVNPLQFGPNEDFESYPRDFERDEQLAKNVGVDYLFYPTRAEMYPEKMTTNLQVIERTNVLCGKNRHGHFDGVVTVLLKLFSITQPKRVYFGLKDAQQVAVVDGLIHDFNLPITLVPVPTVREEDGLAKSSRNVNLSPNERRNATILYETLLFGKEIILSGVRSTAQVLIEMENYIESITLGELEYIEILSFPDLIPQQTLTGKIIIAIAVKYEKARLIDNIIFHIN